MSTPATPADQIKRPQFKTADLKDIVERLDPHRHDPQVEYQFSKGRTFKGDPV